jgi:predicted dehydrogenase
VVVATPPASHLPDAQAAAAAGLSSLVEKPPAPDAAQARSLAELDPAPWIGFNRRFDPAVRELRDRVDRSGPLRLELTFNYRRASWQARMVKDDPLLDVGTHLLDLARWVSRSDLRRVRAETLNSRRCRLELELEAGTASISCTNDRPYLERVTVLDAPGSRVAAWSRGGLLEAVRARLHPGASPLLESLAAELVAFCEAVRGRTATDLATAVDGTRALAAVEAARRSDALGRTWVVVN